MRDRGGKLEQGSESRPPGRAPARSMSDPALVHRCAASGTGAGDLGEMSTGHCSRGAASRVQYSACRRYDDVGAPAASIFGTAILKFGVVFESTAGRPFVTCTSPTMVVGWVDVAALKIAIVTLLNGSS